MTFPVRELNRNHVMPLRQHFIELNGPDLSAFTGKELRLRSAASPQTVEEVHTYIESVRFGRDSLFGVCGDDLALIGVAHLTYWEQAAELGLSVLHHYRRRGIGMALFNRTPLRARNLQIIELFTRYLPENEGIMHFARQAAMRVVLDESGADAYLEVPPGNTMTLSQEITDQQVALFNWTLKARFEPIRRLTTAMLSPVDEPR